MALPTQWSREKQSNPGVGPAAAPVPVPAAVSPSLVTRVGVSPGAASSPEVPFRREYKNLYERVTESNSQGLYARLMSEELKKNGKHPEDRVYRAEGIVIGGPYEGLTIRVEAHNPNLRYAFTPDADSILKIYTLIAGNGNTPEKVLTEHVDEGVTGNWSLIRNYLTGGVEKRGEIIPDSETLRGRDKGYHGLVEVSTVALYQVPFSGIFLSDLNPDGTMKVKPAEATPKGEQLETALASQPTETAN